MDRITGKIQALPELDKERLGVAEVKIELARAWGRMMHLQNLLMEWALVGEFEFAGEMVDQKGGE
jgi:hypothetical protein